MPDDRDRRSDRSMYRRRGAFGLVFQPPGGGRGIWQNAETTPCTGIKRLIELKKASTAQGRFLRCRMAETAGADSEVRDSEDRDQRSDIRYQISDIRRQIRRTERLCEPAKAGAAISGRTGRPLISRRFQRAPGFRIGRRFLSGLRSPRPVPRLAMTPSGEDRIADSGFLSSESLRPLRRRGDDGERRDLRADLRKLSAVF